MLRIAVLFLCLTALAPAADLTLSDGTTYHDAQIVTHDAVTATIVYDGGGATLPIAKLPPAIQAQLGYNVQEAKKEIAAEKEAEGQAAADRAKKEAAEQQWQAMKARSVEIDVRVAQVINPSELLGTMSNHHEIMIHLDGVNTSELAKGERYACLAVPDAPFQYVSAPGDASRIKSYTVVPDEPGPIP